jgi:lipoate-protein ligase A
MDALDQELTRRAVSQRRPISREKVMDAMKEGVQESFTGPVESGIQKAKDILKEMSNVNKYSVR